MRLWSRAILVLSTGLLLSCPAGNSPSGGECAVTADCEAGHVCTNGVCVRLCNGDVECPADRPICVDGSCVVNPNPECSFASDCVSYPTSFTECFVPRCERNECDYVPQAVVACGAQSCTAGEVTLGRTCGASGTCPDAGTQSCNGFICDGDGCRTTCSNNSHCVGTLACDTGSGGCTGFLPDGAVCTANGECANVCIDGNCAPVAGTGDECDELADCAGGHTCSGTICLKVDDQSCSANAECLNTCIGDICGPQSTGGGGCDDDGDCITDYACAGDNTCKLDGGVACQVPGDCATGICEDGVCCETICGLCAECGSSGVCESAADDSACTVDCNTLDTPCRDYDNLTDNRCAGAGVCKIADVTNCTDYTDAGPDTYCIIDATCTACNGAGECNATCTCDWSGWQSTNPDINGGWYWMYECVDSELNCRRHCYDDADGAGSYCREPDFCPCTWNNWEYVDINGGYYWQRYCDSTLGLTTCRHRCYDDADGADSCCFYNESSVYCRTADCTNPDPPGCDYCNND